MAKYSYIRINASGDTPMEFVNLADSVTRDEEWNEIKATMSHASDGPIYLKPQKFALWCSDGKRYQVEFYYDDDGLAKVLYPNHRFNAMAHAGRFTTKKFDYVGKSKQEELKTWWGSNYAVGDVIVKVQTGKPIPDVSVFGDNPIKFIFQYRDPNARMLSKYGDRATKIMSAFKGKKMPQGLVSLDALENAEWERKEYRINCTKGEQDEEYNSLVEDWMDGLRAMIGAAGMFL
ncbi:MAG: hypothetical protein CL525_12505 [Aequorivita sp.]|nr:hypothetical protein [Aequorivita sp.]|tara:strand:+ start:87 stop:785 length:699 start_codon:yes stop_codon:yes gene_type:complete